MDFQMGGNQPSQNTKMKKEKEIPQLALSNRCVETSAQINQVLQVMAMTSASLSNYKRQSFSMFDDEGKSQAKHPLKMTEGELALEKTLWSACARMEKILNDDSRWADDFQRKIEREYDELHALQMKAIAKQKEAADEVTSPHFRYRPDLKRLRDGRWMAILGDVEHLEFAIYGVGVSAHLALLDFDSVFRTGVPASVAAYAQQREAALENGHIVPPFPNKEQTHEKNDDTKMDDGTDSNRDSAS